MDQAKQFVTDALKTSSKRKKEEKSRSNYWVNWIGNTTADVVPDLCDGKITKTLSKGAPRKSKTYMETELQININGNIYISIDIWN